MNSKLLVVLLIFAFSACQRPDKEEPTPEDAFYFPPNKGTSWEKLDMNKLGWNQTAVNELNDFLKEKNSKAFMILVNGRIVMEEYYNGHKSAEVWQWNSAGKTLAATATGIAEQEGLLKIDDRVSKYLKPGWSSAPRNKEDLISSRHLLTMTSGLDDSKQMVTKENLTYMADAGTRWSYHNVFQLLMDVVSAASNKKFENFFDEKLKEKIGMDGFWRNGLIFTIYHSTARSMARFGLIALNNGRWKNEQIINEKFFKESTSTSQSINPSYGYLWWLNGKTKYMLPSTQAVFQGTLVPNAPADMYAAMGAEDQRLYVIPSKNMVVVRMGDAAEPKNPSFAVSGFDNALWEKINKVIQKNVIN